MTASVERIEQEIALLEQALATLAEAFQNAYTAYLSALGQAVRKQHVLAAYQVCTQGYPQQFLALSVGQRQILQQALSNLAKQAQANLLEQLHPFQPEELLKRPEQPAIPRSISVAEAHDSQATELEALPANADDLASTQSTAKQSIEQSNQKDITLTPALLIQWQVEVEQGIGRELATISHQTNRLLQQSNILPGQLPEALLQHASKTELLDGVPRSPNLLNVLVEAVSDAETPQDDDEKAPEILQVLAIHLRLVEIEFADTPTMATRSKIRELTARLKKLGQDYRKKQREYAIASAQDAWRASWFEESP
ncbi:hypothetical protein JOY44_10835 [Phormidium sp. CLA17]|uniref:hypothetical protein n=1 Tax=Leptolyngbya sp. Cla-17 TaxID=2803751 RepID=UPI0014914E21|nr:hypothetical protein [Leptolyngbya sp. Cla-17]MBM0742111.1 hypothetical protein [Leptolyngbya sp. Cla-17]